MNIIKIDKRDVDKERHVVVIIDGFNIHIYPIFGTGADIRIQNALEHKLELVAFSEQETTLRIMKEAGNGR